jgi:hypothetical protein
MLRKFLVASTAVAAISTLLFVSQSAEALRRTQREGDRAEEIRDFRPRAQAAESEGQHWAKKNGYKTVSLSKVATKCSGKGALNHCTVAAKVCGH